ncbi:MAG: putative cysteine protease YraA [Gammaproteobacteria bacterium]|nr:putative cysteine protease YraA [Gammaproteobacteria bacterium]
MVLTADQFEDSELLVPYEGLRQEGLDVDIVAAAAGRIRGKHGHEVDAGVAADDVNPDDYDLLIIPGGRAPEELCRHPAAARIIDAFFTRHKPVAAICHGPLLLAQPHMIAGRTVTGHRSLADRLRAAGAHYEDRDVVVDGNLITSRVPADLPVFMREVINLVRVLRGIPSQ